MTSGTAGEVGTVRCRESCAAKEREESGGGGWRVEGEPTEERREERRTQERGTNDKTVCKKSLLSGLRSPRVGSLRVQEEVRGPGEVVRG